MSTPDPVRVHVTVTAADLLRVSALIREALTLLDANVATHRLGASGVTLASEAVAAGDLADALPWIDRYALNSGQAVRRAMGDYA